jgi:hypothetical protein
VRSDRDRVADLDGFYCPARRAEFRMTDDEEWEFYHCVLSVRHADGSLDLYPSARAGAPRSPGGRSGLGRW